MADRKRKETRHAPRWVLMLCCAALLFLFAGCAGKSPTPLPPGATPAIQGKPSSPKALAVVRTARGMIGARYKWGGESPSQGFDCSGLVWYSFYRHGINLPRVSWQQFGVGKNVSRSQLRAGDLIFHKVTKSGKQLHVGIVTERGTFVHSPSSGKRVTETPISNTYWTKHFLGARRVF